jgi:hypothetical protein
VNPGGKVCCHHNHSFDIVLDRSNELMTIQSTSGAPELKIRHRSGIISVASDEEWTVLADHDSSFSVYKHRRFQFSIPIFTSSVRCLCVSGRFKMVVCGTKDCSLLFCSLNKGYVTRIVPLATKRPIRIMVTQSWGFVLVCLRCLGDQGVQNSLAIFTVNGELINEVSLPGRVVAWSTFDDGRGFDYLAIALENGQCFVCEAFYLRMRAPCFESKAHVLGIGFSRVMGVGAIVTADGGLTLFPADMDGAEMVFFPPA